MTKAMNLREWRQAQLVPDRRGGTRSMSQKELAAKVGVGNSLISRIESGERWPSIATTSELIGALRATGLDYHERCRVFAAQLRTWRAFSKDRKGKRP